MCGIAGYIGNNIISQQNIEKTLKLMKNRGPNHQAYLEFRESQYYTALLHSRLSIIDLDKRSNQPFSLNDYTIVFNGEIYNYIELSKELSRRQIHLFTKSDTEVLLWYFILFGENCVEYFEGMWAFDIFNRKSGFFGTRRNGIFA